MELLLAILFLKFVFSRNIFKRIKRKGIYRSHSNFVLFCGILTKTLKAIDMHTYTVMEPLIPENSIVYYKPFRNRKNNIRKKDIVRKGDYILYNIPADIYYKKYKNLDNSNSFYLIGKVHNISREGIEVLLEKKSTGFDIDSTDFGFLNPIYVKGIITDILLKDHEELNSTDLCHT